RVADVLTGRAPGVSKASMAEVVRVVGDAADVSMGRAPGAVVAAATDTAQVAGNAAESSDGLDPTSPIAATRRARGAALAALQQHLAGGTSRLVVVTRRAVAISAEDSVPDPAAAAVWGLVRSAQTEHPDRISVVDLAAGDTLDVAAVL